MSEQNLFEDIGFSKEEADCLLLISDNIIEFRKKVKEYNLHPDKITDLLNHYKDRINSLLNLYDCTVCRYAHEHLENCDYYKEVFIY